MTSAFAQYNRRFIALLMKGYIFGTIVSAFVLHIAIALIAPGDGGTALVLGDGAILFVLLIALALISLIAFPLAALASWPFRGLVFGHPLAALALCAVVGCLVGTALTATEFKVGPGDFWSGPIVGLTYGVVWFFVVRCSHGSKSDHA
jgi:hypothetical protein